MKRPFFSLLLLLSLALPAAALDVPSSNGYVTDRAGIISSATEQKIERYLRSFEESDSTQIAVLTIGSLQGEAVDEYALKVAESWGIGQKEHDNGALLLVAKEDRKIRIEVGYGLEGKLTDLLAGRIIDNEISPRFKQGDFDGGIIAGVGAMTQAVRGEYKGTGRPAGKKKRSPLGLLFFLFFLGPGLLRLFLPHSRYGRSRGIW
ncbi:MAG: hypothetical protein BA869_10125, partial [Desulfuromonadales bacterium C00003107]